jgi:hypothetical protein
VGVVLTTAIERIEALPRYTTEAGSTEARAWVPLAEALAALEALRSDTAAQAAHPSVAPAARPETEA